MRSGTNRYIIIRVFEQVYIRVYMYTIRRCPVSGVKCGVITDCCVARALAASDECGAESATEHASRERLSTRVLAFPTLLAAMARLMCDVKSTLRRRRSCGGSRMAAARGHQHCARHRTVVSAMDRGQIEFTALSLRYRVYGTEFTVLSIRISDYQY